MRDETTTTRRLLDLASVTALALGGFALVAIGRQPRPAATAVPGTPDMAAHPPISGPSNDTGAGAATPLQLPAPDWKDILRRTASGLSKDRILAEAAGVTFYGLLALFPALATLISIYGLFSNPASVEGQVQALSGVLPGGGMEIITQQLHALTSSPPKALGLGVVIGFLTSIWSANAGMKAMFDALNAVYEETETRGFVRLTLRSLAFTVGAIVFLALAMVALVVAPAVTRWIGSPLVDALVVFGRWPLLLVVVTVFLAVLYRYGPCRGWAPWRWVTWGGAAAAIGWLLVSAAFSYYAANFGSYNKTYGSLGAAVGLMTWIWLSTSVILLGAELDSQIARKAKPA